MVQATIPKNIELYADGTDPDPMEVKVVKGALQDIHRCDAIDDGTAVWSVHSGAGVTIALDNSIVQEGTGSIKVTVPAGITAIIKCTKASGSWNLSSYKYLKVYLRKSTTITMGSVYFGEAAYNEQGQAFSMGSNVWWQKNWDISGIAAASRDAVTIFAVSATAGGPGYFWIDYVYADPGPSEIVGNDGDRRIRLYPKVYVGNYTGNGTSQTITIPRKGTPAMVFVKETGSVGGPSAIWWHKDMTATYSEGFGGGNKVTNAITGVADGSFTVGGNAAVNTNGLQYNFFVLWED